MVESVAPALVASDFLNGFQDSQALLRHPEGDSYGALVYSVCHGKSSALCGVYSSLAGVVYTRKIDRVPVFQVSSCPMKRTPLSRKTPIRKRNAKRMAKRKLKYWGPPGYVEFVKGKRCCACHKGHPECAHEPSRAAGGTWKDIVPLCSGCHRTRPGAVHQIGRSEFEKRNRVDFDEVKARLLREWQSL
ncbi:MAG: hypothetical protein ACPIOQ_06645 [Promethearchaeia archaeon]